MEYSARNRFVSQTFDRLATRRTDTPWRQRVMETDRALILPVWRAKVPADERGELHFVAPSKVSSADLSHAILLGVWNGLPCFAVDLGQDEATPSEMIDIQHHSLRSVGALAQADAAALAAYAQAMVFWHRRHRFCGTCGQQNISREGGHVLQCSGCQSKQFPRSDPAIIVLVVREEKALLGRQSTWPPGMYSTIAGFVEPGESLENAVRREVAEETGVKVDSVAYHSSQPWPFPASLMVGFQATATEHRTSLRDDELEDVRWFSRSDIVEGIGDGLLTMATPISIAFRLIEHWFDADTPGRLARHVADARRKATD